MKIKVTVGKDGTLTLVTQGGTFEQGKPLLEGLLDALNASGVEAQQTGAVETHRHDLELSYLSEGSARLTIHEAVREDGAPHTH